MFPYQLSVTSYQLSKTGIILFYITNLSEKCYTARGDNLNFCVGWVMSIAHLPHEYISKVKWQHSVQLVHAMRLIQGWQFVPHK
jgi:hypothetical protein